MSLPLCKGIWKWGTKFLLLEINEIISFESKLEGVTDSVRTGITSDVTTAGTASLLELTTSATAAAASTYELAQQPRTDVVNMVAAVANTITSNATDAIAFDRTAWIG